MKKKVNALALLLAVLVLFSLMSACGEKQPEVETVETEEVTLVETEGVLVSFEEGVLTLDVDGDEQRFFVAADTAFSLARGFIAGDTLTVSYEEDNAETVLSVASVESSGLKPYTLRGTVKSLGEHELRVALDDGGTADFALSGAALDLWQGLREGIYVELTCLGDSEGGSCIWLQSVTDNDGAALLTAPQEEATGETTTETVEITEEATAETVEYAWPYEACDDTVWASVRANLRTGPGMEYPCVGDVDCGEELSRRGLSGDWSAVMIDGREYYIASELLLAERPGKLSTITYDANGGKAAPEAQHKLGGEGIHLSLLEPVREGWKFVNWNTNEKGFGVTFFAGDEYEMDGDATLYAQWVEAEDAVTEEEPTAAGEPNGEQPTEETAESTEETTEETAAPVRDTSSAIAGTLVSMQDGKLTLEAAGLEYVFDIASATVTAERGVHPGDGVTLYYAGTLGADRDSSAAPAVRVQITADDGSVTGEVTAVGQGFVAVSLGKTELFAAVDGLDAEAGDEITLVLAPSAAQGNLFEASAK